MNFVLDSSLALTFVFTDEATPATDAVLDSLGQGAKAFVPALWRWEVANVLLVAERGKRITQATAQQHLSQFKALPIEVDDAALDQVWTATHALGQKHKLSSYDATYLEMAIRLAVALGSLDSELRAAAKVEKVPLLPEQ
jgi:predicted nucleic acid-binding protein